MEFDPGVVGAETPVDADAGGVATGLVGGDGAFQGVGVGVSAPLRQARLNALNSISAMFTQLACLRRVVKLQAYGNAPGLGGGKGLIERGPAVSVQSLPRT